MKPHLLLAVFASVLTTSALAARVLDEAVVATGEKDESEATESGHVLRDYFARHLEKNFTFIEYPNASHALHAPEAHLQDYIASLANWFDAHKPAAP